METPQKICQDFQKTHQSCQAIQDPPSQSISSISTWFPSPKGLQDAMRLDKENGNTHWQDAMDLELTQIHNTRFSRTQVKHNSTMEKWSYLMVFKRSESTLYMQSNMMADSKQDLLQMDISPKNLLNPSILEWFP